MPIFKNLYIEWDDMKNIHTTEQLQPYNRMVLLLLYNNRIEVNIENILFQ